jgi:hypothetical protein
VTAFAWGALLALGLAAAAPAAAQTPTGTANPAAASEVEILRQRVATYWAARVTRDATAFWQLIEPRGKGRMTAEEYAAQGASVKYTGYRVEEATIDGNFATVKVRLVGVPELPLMRSSASQSIPQASVIDDQWVRVRGAWYRVVDKLEQ